MVDPTDISGRIETRDDLGKPSSEEAIWAYWQGQEKIAEKEERKWVSRARKIVERYRDERPESNNKNSRFNILWSNIETLKPTLYARTPKPDVQRTFKDDDPIGLFAAEILQRCLEYSCDAHNHHFDQVMKAVVQDRLLPGRAVARVLYVPHYGDEIEEDGVGVEAKDTYKDEDEAGTDVTSEADATSDDEKKEKFREVVYEEATAKYIFWEDYREGPARTWEEVPWVRYRAYLTRDQLVDRFKAKGKKVNLDYEPRGSANTVEKDKSPSDLFKKAAVHEYWDKNEQRVIWIAPGTPDLVLDQDDDPLRLPGFFPNPDPLLANSTNDKRIPIPDYIQYQDQARELDKITSRIDKLTGALQVKGLYPGESKNELQQLIDEGTENRLVPVHDWQPLLDKGGIKDIIQWFPIQQIAECLIQLYNARDRTKAILYELTGMSDILRGQTSPIETKGAQDLKAAFATRRIAPKQKEVANFACDLIKLKGAIIAEHFSEKTISMITGYPQSQMQPVPQLPPPPPQMIPAQQPQGPAPAPGGPPGAAAVVAGGPPAPPQPGGPPAPAIPGQQMVAMQPNPAYAQWQQMQQAVQKLQQANQAAQQKFQQAVALIKEDGVHGFRIDIEADSTIAPDEEAEKQSRTEFLQQFVPFLEQIVPMCMGNPALADLGESLTLFAMRPFKVARTLEDAVTKAFAAIKTMPPPQQEGGSGPDSPADLALRSKETNAKLQIANQKTAVDFAKISSQERIQSDKLALESKMHHDTLAAGISKEADQRAFRDIRGAAIESKEAASLQ